MLKRAHGLARVTDKPTSRLGASSQLPVVTVEDMIKCSIQYDSLFFDFFFIIKHYLLSCSSFAH
jgi:hypothetical protein